MLARAGVDQGSLSTWDGVLAAARALKDKKIVEFPLVWSWKRAESLEEDVRRIFSDGQAAMALNWTYLFNAANDREQSKIAGSVGIARTPDGGAGAPGVNGSMALSIRAGSRNREAAWTFMSYLTSPGVQEAYSSLVAILPQVVPVAKRRKAAEEGPRRRGGRGPRAAAMTPPAGHWSSRCTT